MKIKFLTVITGLLMAAFMITSCLNDDDNEVTLSSESSITAFSIKDNIETKYTAKVNGKDTTLTATVKGSDYPFIIDQVERRIYNADSLPVGTNVSKVVVEITADTPYILIVADKDSLWTSTDSLNFENPVKFKVMAQSMEYGAVYTAEINVHKQEPDSLVWSNLSSNFNGSVIQAQKAVYFNDKIYVFARQDEGKVAVTTTSITDGHSWSALQPLSLEKADYSTAMTCFNINTMQEFILEKADYSTAMTWGDHLYIIAENQLYQSENGTDWSKIESAPKLKMLVSNIYSQNNPEENNKLIAINTDNVFVESHNGTEWTEQESVPYGFPETSLSFVSYPLNTNSSIDRMLVLGENPIATDTTSVVWAQLSTENTWGNYPPEKDNLDFCPKLENIAMIHYNNQLYAFGGPGKKNGSNLAPFSAFYESVNNGITWQQVKRYVFFPEEFSNLYKQADGNYSYVIDKNNYLWIMWSKSGQVWRGRINKLGFKKSI